MIKPRELWWCSVGLGAQKSVISNPPHLHFSVFFHLSVHLTNVLSSYFSVILLQRWIFHLTFNTFLHLQVSFSTLLFIEKIIFFLLGLASMSPKFFIWLSCSSCELSTPIPSVGPSFFLPKWRMMSWPSRLLCFTRQDRPDVSVASTSKETLRYHVPSALGKISLCWVPCCTCSPRIHLTQIGFGWKPETWQTSIWRSERELVPVDSQASGFTAEHRKDIQIRTLTQTWRFMSSHQFRQTHLSHAGNSSCVILLPLDSFLSSI